GRHDPGRAGRRVRQRLRLPRGLAARLPRAHPRGAGPGHGTRHRTSRGPAGGRLGRGGRRRTRGAVLAAAGRADGRGHALAARGRRRGGGGDRDPQRGVQPAPCPLPRGSQVTPSVPLGTHIEVSDLVVRYGRCTALAGLDLKLDTGVYGLLGPNGAGKTTLIRVLASIARPASGQVSVLGQDLRDHRSLRQVRRRLGYLAQQFGYYPRFTVREFVEYIAWLKETHPASVPA